MVKWCVKDFLSQYSSHSTIANYKGAFRLYFTCLYPGLGQLKVKELDVRINDVSLEYVTVERDYRKDLITFRERMKDMAPKTRTTRYAPILRFLEDNEVTFNRSFVKNLLGKGAFDAISEEFVPNNEDLSRLLSFMPIQAKTLTLVLASSGMRLGEALSLKLDDLDLERTPARINIRGEYTKTKKKRFTFISTEAKCALEEWLPYRPKYAMHINLKAHKKVFDSEDPLVFPFSSNNYICIWELACEKAGLLKRDKYTRRMMLHPHNLRKFYRVYGKWKNPDIAEALMGHQSGLTAIYARFDQAEKILEEGYLEAEPNLGVSENTATMIKLKQKVEKQSDDLQQLVTNLSLKNVRLENDMHKMEDELREVGLHKDRDDKLLDLLLEAAKRNPGLIDGILRETLA